MPERKYTRFGERPERYECTNRKCKWQGTVEEKSSKWVDSIETALVCPDCGSDEFYGLLK